MNEFTYDSFKYALTYLQNADINELICADNLILINNHYNIHSKPCITSLDVKKVINQTKVFAENIENILSDEN